MDWERRVRRALKARRTAWKRVRLGPRFAPGGWADESRRKPRY